MTDQFKVTAFYSDGHKEQQTGTAEALFYGVGDFWFDADTAPDVVTITRIKGTA